MIPKEPVYPLNKAIERVKDTIPDQDAEGWLRDAIAADRIGWAYVWIEGRDSSCPLLIDILPMAAIMEVPGEEFDWSKGMATVQRRHKGVVECPIVISRRDLDRELVSASTPSNDYSSSYVNFMKKASQDLSLDANTKIPKKELVNWLRDNWHEGLGEFSARKIDQMATLIREPEDQKGGHFKPRRED